MAEKMTAQDALLNAALVCTETKMSMLDTLIHSAGASIVQADKVTIADVFEIGKTDELIRLQRNMVALKMLLNQAKDATLCIKGEIRDLLKAFEEAETERRRRQQEALAREQERKKERDKYHKKKGRKGAEENK